MSETRKLPNMMYGTTEERQRAIFERVSKPSRGQRPLEIHNREDLCYFKALVRLRSDWHEPDVQDVEAYVFGHLFDNAGFWSLDDVYEISGEKHVVLYVERYPVLAVNLATLFSWATDADPGRPVKETIVGPNGEEDFFIVRILQEEVQ